MRTGRGAVIAAVALVLLAGCTDEPDDDATTPVPTSTVAPTSSAPTATTPAAPTLPEAATAPDAAGAEAFVRYWFDVANYSVATGDTEPLDAISLPDCKTCDNVMANVDKVYGAGGRIEGAGLTVTYLAAPAPDEVQNVEATTSFVQAAGQEIAEDGTVTVEPAEPEVTVVAFLSYRDSAWALFDMGGTA